MYVIHGAKQEVQLQSVEEKSPTMDFQQLQLNDVRKQVLKDLT